MVIFPKTNLTNPHERRLRKRTKRARYMLTDKDNPFRGTCEEVEDTAGFILKVLKFKFACEQVLTNFTISMK